jgi:acetylornithine deacetylase/succinyl-diaminopimelate desuccinylase-like protein
MFRRVYGDDMEERIIQLVTDLVAIPTDEREQEAQELIASWLRPLGFDCTLQEIEPGRLNLVAHRDGRGGTFLCSHVDVHPPHAHPDPWTVRRDGDLLVGRGVLDAKGQIAAIVAAVEAQPETGALVVITCDEEAGGKGSELVSFPDGPWSQQGGIVLEPTDFGICTAQAGNIDVRIDVAGASGHAYARDGRPSATQAVLSAIEELDTCRFLRADHPLLGRPRTNIGRLRAGEHRWRTPAGASLEMTLGVVPGTDLAEAEAEVCDRLTDLASRWTKRGATFTFEVLDTSEPTEVLARDVPIASKLADALGEPLSPAGMPSWTDAGFLLTKHQLPCVVFGAGDLGSAHSDHEWVRVADLLRLADVLAALLAGS